MGKVNPNFIGLSQYKAPFCYELGGKHFHLVMDDGSELSLNFLDGESVQIAEKGQPYVFETYECMKGDDTTYFVHVQPVAGKGLINKSWILDTEQRLVTYVVMEEGYDPEYPRLIRVEPFFGAIKVPGRELPKIRHHLSKRLVGRHIYWRYNPGFRIQHIYHTPTIVRANLGPDSSFIDENNLYKDLLESPDPAVRAEGQKKLEHFRQWRKLYPFYEEECFHVWIKENMNVFCFVEENANRLDPERHSGGGGILLLQEINRLTDVGLCFSAGEYYMITALGDMVDDPDPLDTTPSPYDFSGFDAMPTVHREIPEE